MHSVVPEPNQPAGEGADVANSTTTQVTIGTCSECQWVLASLLSRLRDASNIAVGMCSGIKNPG